MERLIRSNNQFVTYQLCDTSVQHIVSSHIYIGNSNERKQIGQELFKFIDESYDGVGGFKSFKDVDHFIDNSYLWYITYDGQQPESLDQFDVKKVLVVSVFRHSHGLKLVGLARRVIGKTEHNKQENILIRRNANSALYEHISFLKNKQTGWAEVSGKLEDYFKQVFDVTDIIDPYDLKEHRIFNNIDIDIDELHYYRPLHKGEEPVKKIAYGRIVLK